MPHFIKCVHIIWTITQNKPLIFKKASPIILFKIISKYKNKKLPNHEEVMTHKLNNNNIKTF
jgi:hypothetical protein